MRAQEVIISNPKRDAVDSAVLCTISAGDTVGFLEGTVQALNELFERAEFFRYFIVICKADDLSDKDFPVLFDLELLGSKWIGAVAISDESQGFARELLKLIKCHPHGKNARTDISGC